MYNIYPENAEVMKDRDIINNYIHGGRGIVDLISPSDNKHTYAFLKPKNPSIFPDDVVFVYAYHEYSKLFYIGMIEDGKFRLTRHSRFLVDTEIVKGAIYINKMATIPEFAEKSQMTLKHLGMCARCGRPLSDEKSLKEGIGKKCKKKLQIV